LDSGYLPQVTTPFLLDSGYLPQVMDTLRTEIGTLKQQMAALLINSKRQERDAAFKGYA
jgi:hypothetical protein